MRSITIQIPKPCHEQWDDMQPAERGRFCASCQKTVIDYTLLSDQELVKLFRKSSETTCGRFNDEQLNRPLAPVNQPALSVWRNWLSLFTLSLVSWQSAWAQLHSANQTSRPASTQQPINRPSYSANPILTHTVCKPNASWTISGRIMYVAPSGYLSPVVGINVYVSGIPSIQIHDTYQAKTDTSGSFSIVVPMHQQITQLKLQPLANDFRPKTVQIDASPMTDTILSGDIIIRKIPLVRNITSGGVGVVQAPSHWQKIKRKLFR